MIRHDLDGSSTSFTVSQQESYTRAPQHLPLEDAKNTTRAIGEPSQREQEGRGVSSIPRNSLPKGMLSGAKLKSNE